MNISLIVGTLIAILAASIGGIGTAVVTKLLSRKEVEFQQQLIFRQEHRDENEVLLERVARLEQRLDVLRSDYFSLVEKVIKAYRDEAQYKNLYLELADGLPEHWTTNDDVAGKKPNK